MRGNAIGSTTTAAEISCRGPGEERQGFGRPTSPGLTCTCRHTLRMQAGAEQAPNYNPKRFGMTSRRNPKTLACNIRMLQGGMESIATGNDRPTHSCSSHKLGRNTALPRDVALLTMVQRGWARWEGNTRTQGTVRRSSPPLASTASTPVRQQSHAIVSGMKWLQKAFSWYFSSAPSR